MLGRKRQRLDHRRLAQGLAVMVFMLDQMVKFYLLYILDLPSRHVVPLLPPFLDLAMVWNTGVTFGLLKAGNPWGTWLLAGLAIGISFWLFRAIALSERVLPALCYGIIAGGALGNVVDRLRLGRVVDFIHVHWGSFDPFPFVFNIGDSAIVVGVGILLLDSWRPRLPQNADEG